MAALFALKYCRAALCTQSLTKVSSKSGWLATACTAIASKPCRSRLPCATGPSRASPVTPSSKDLILRLHSSLTKTLLTARDVTAAVALPSASSPQNHTPFSQGAAIGQPLLLLRQVLDISRQTVHNNNIRWRFNLLATQMKKSSKHVTAYRNLLDLLLHRHCISFTIRTHTLTLYRIVCFIYGTFLTDTCA